MGVHGTFCQLCGMPTQHDHYVPSHGMLKIYRGAAGPGGGHTWEADEKPFAFGPQHAWLEDAVVLPWHEPRVLRGRIEDGSLEGVMVFDGGEDGLALHHACWRIEGSPASTEPAFRANGTHAWALVESYHEQLFDFASLAADGKGWMLEEPLPGSRSRARIEAMLQIPEAAAPVQTVEESVRVDRDWAALPLRDEQGRRALVRARGYTLDEVPSAGFETLVRMTKFYEEPRLPGGEELQELEAFEVALKTAVERDAQGILMLAAIGKGRAEYLTYARDGAATCERIAALDGAKAGNLEVSADPNWQEARRVLTSFRR